MSGGDDAAEREVAALAAPGSGPGVPRPAYDGRSLPNVTVSVLRALGKDRLVGDAELAPPLRPEIDPFGGRRAEGPVVLFLIDGFGWHSLRAWSSSSGDPLARRWRSMARPITTVFPSSTAAALPSLSTGVPPGRHGMVGYRQYLPAYGVIADLLKMAPLGSSIPESLVGPTWSPGLVCGVPNLFSRGVPGVALARAAFRGTGFTRILYEGSEFVTYATLSDLAQNLKALLERPTPPPFVMVYWDELDTIQHLWGPRPELIRLELDQIARAIDHVRDTLDPSRRRATTFLATGDHGQVWLEASAELHVDREPGILRHLARPLAGDRRIGLLSARHGQIADLQVELGRRLPPGSRVLSFDEALQGGLFGPPPYHPELAERVGDLLVLLRSPAGITYLPPGAKPPDHHREGGHGGLEPDELVVPLVAGSLADLDGDLPPATL